jgi:hypothetical protein
MKIALLTILCFFALNSKAQTYFDNDSRWRFIGAVENWGCQENDDYMYFVDGDSLINGQTYKLLIRKGYRTRYPWNGTGNCPDTSFHYEIENSLVRQDGKKIFEIPIGDSVEHILYDFDLQMGDSVFIMQNYLHIGQVVAIDSFLVNGEYNKRFVVTDGIYTNVLMEGIGYENLDTQMVHESDLFHQNDYWVLQMDLLCYSENGTSYYTQPGEECYFDLGTEELESQIKYVYDLESQILEIQFKQNSRPQEVLIYNTLAQEVNCSRIETSEAIRFETQTLESGAYFVVLRWDNYQESFKIVIQ